MKDIYDLKLFESTQLPGFNPTDSSGCLIRRVPGGWTFTQWEDSHSEDNYKQTSLASVFVPYDPEFKQGGNVVSSSFTEAGVYGDRDRD